MTRGQRVIQTRNPFQLRLFMTPDEVAASYDVDPLQVRWRSLTPGISVSGDIANPLLTADDAKEIAGLLRNLGDPNPHGV
jgi:hypothetical protein